MKIDVPTSDLIDVARAAALLWAKRIPKGEDYYEVRETSWPGYAMVLYSEGVHPWLEIGIRLKTGQVVALPDDCIVFRSPELDRFAKDVQYLTKERPLSPQALADELSCPGVKIIRAGRPRAKVVK